MEKTQARKFFDALEAYNHQEYLIEEEIFTKILGVTYEEGSNPCPCDDWTWDPYDYSFEFKKTQNGWFFTDDQLKQIEALGFHRFWICYLDGTERYHYCGPKAPNP